MSYYKWKPSQKQKKEFAQKMNEIDEFCYKNGISQSASSDSYYFTIDNQKYRVSNHSVEASNAHAYNAITGEQYREAYHPEGREHDTIYIHASKTRIIEIYNDLRNGFQLDGRGYRINQEVHHENAPDCLSTSAQCLDMEQTM
ncbi:MAG: hypothetical protein LUH82_07900 [Clostridiales bacterium]|nr:hypothetical protein [Clostridiales bacterium]